MFDSRPSPPSRTVNRFSGLATFVRAWDDREDPGNAVEPALRRGPRGNVNNSGRPDDDHGASVPRYNPRFVEALEPGVRDLVLRLVRVYGWMTFASCEGHAALDGVVGPRERLVSLIPRSAVEERRARIVLESARLVATSRDPASAVRPCLDDVPLVVDGGLRLRTLELTFRKSDGASWEAYFEELPTAYARFLGGVWITS